MRLGILLMLFGLYHNGSGQPMKGTLRVSVSGLRSQSGRVAIRIFDRSGGFPSKDEVALKELYAVPVDGVAVFEIQAWPYGEYAIGCIHDENDNKKFDRNFLGIPLEGFGTSNNSRIIVRPPSFDKAAFQFEQSDMTLHIMIRYFL